jgi:hypothetical protein
MTPPLPPSLRKASPPGRVFPVRFVAPSVLFAVLAMATGTAVRAAEPALPTADIVPDLPAKLSVPPDDPAVQAHLRGCMVWTDRCVTCEREAAGRISCSNIGIACQPRAVECVRSETAQEKEPADKKQDN